MIVYSLIYHFHFDKFRPVITAIVLILYITVLQMRDLYLTSSLLL